MNRRQFAQLLATPLFARPTFAETLGTDMTRRKIPSLVAMVATPDKITYTEADGAKLDDIFVIASMTKAITAAAAMQLVEQGKVKLHEPVGKYLPELAKLDVLTGFDAAGKPQLRPATKPVTLHHLLTHTSGFAYDTWDATMMKYTEAKLTAPVLIFDPGTRWQYGTSMDWAGRLVETISGLTLEDYFQKNILQPLGMKDTSFIVPAAKLDRLATSYRRQPNGTLKADPHVLPPVPKVFNGGGGVYSTAADYVLFMQAILHHGKPILQPKTVAMMTSNQIGDISAGKLKTFRPAISADVDFHPGVTDGFTYGFLINKTAYPGGRSAGSLAWAGIENTFYWIDPKKQLCAVILMQFFPFVDPEAAGLLSDFEKTVYAK
jgi:methyl acetate hydrolase